MTQPQPHPRQDTGSWWQWRPSMFAPNHVSHLAREGQTPQLSDDYPGEPWVWAACGQLVAPDVAETGEMARCPECLGWWQRQQPAR